MDESVTEKSNTEGAAQEVRIVFSRQEVINE